MITSEYIKGLLELLTPSLLDTLYMVFFSTIFAVLIGLPLGIILVITEKGHIWEKPNLNKVLSFIINMMRSLPFIILIIAIFLYQD